MIARACLVILSILLSVFYAIASADGVPSYWPVRPPAVPLAVRSPYTNAWTSTTKNGTLNTAGAIFWPGNKLGWEGIVTVDGVSYEYLGTGSESLPALPNIRKATPLSVRYDSQYSNFLFAAGPVTVEASFFSPVTPKDLCRTSIPLSYLVTSVNSTDGRMHNVQLYSDTNAAWITYESNRTVKWELYDSTKHVNASNSTVESSSVLSWLVHLNQTYEFAELHDFPEWGAFSYSSSPGKARNFSSESGYSANVRYNYIMRHRLANYVDREYRESGIREPVFAYAHDLGSVRFGSVVYTVGSIQQPIMRYLNSKGLTSLQPWWVKCYGDMYSLIAFHYNDLNHSQSLGRAFESDLKRDINMFYGTNETFDSLSSASNKTPISPSYGKSNYSTGTDQFGQQYVFDCEMAYGFLDPNDYSGIAVPNISEAMSYYSIVALSARQVMGAYVLTERPTGTGSNETSTDDPLMFQKEISSNGNINTVDVLYPAMPFFLYTNAALLRYTLDPLYQNQESKFYPNGYAMHDLGASFPNATGHVEGNDEYMPVESSGDMILMTYAYSQFSGDTAYLHKHYGKMTEWAQYLLKFSMVPNQQLSTDDFAGQLVNQTNLAIKGIVAIAAMSRVSKAVGANADAVRFSAAASDYIRKWEYLAVDPSENHTVLAYGWRSSWGLLYNIFPDKLLDIDVVPQSIYDMQSNWYAQVSQIFGVPLDSRHSLTKSDWEMWAAATCEPSTRRLFVDAIAYWLNVTATDLPFTDLYNTVGNGDYPNTDDGNPIKFSTRPVQGGTFALLALGAKGSQNTTSPP